MKEPLNIQAIIDSGILEQYALGLTDLPQNEEISKLLKKYPELQKELVQIQQALENYASQYAVPLPDSLKEKILLNIEEEKKSDFAKRKLKNNLLQSILFISIPLLLIIGYFWSQNVKLESKLNNELNKNKELRDQAHQDSIGLIDCNELLQIYRNKDSKRVILNGTPKSPQSFAAIYYDTLSKKSYLDVIGLPAVPIKKQYQLWAIVSGQPVDLGVFNLSDKNTVFKEIKYIDKAQAFAITLEPEGGLPSPTMDQMFVIGSM